jgi:hypothetical protein
MPGVYNYAKQNEPINSSASSYLRAERLATFLGLALIASWP